QGGGIFKTVDGGRSFQKLSRGLPNNKLGRIGLDYYVKDPNIVVAIIDCEKIGMGPPPKKIASGNAFLGAFGVDVDEGVKLVNIMEGGPAEKAGLRPDDVIRMIGKKRIETYEEMAEEIRTYQPKDKVSFQVLREKKPETIEVTLGERPGGP